MELCWPEDVVLGTYYVLTMLACPLCVNILSLLLLHILLYYIFVNPNIMCLPCDNNVVC